MTAVRLHDVTVRYDAATALDRLSLEVRPGEWLALIGPNGAGKSTLLRALAGLVAYQGSISIDGSAPRALGRRGLARRIALVPQHPLVPPDLTVGEYVLLGRTPYISYFGTERPADLDATHEILARLDLTALEARRLGTLSGGERQRAVLARALAQQAPLLLLDEPTRSLDVGHQQQVLELVETLRRTDDLTVVTALHDLTLAGQFADRLVLLSGGRQVAAGTARQVLTPARIRQHYGADVRVLQDAAGGVAVIPTRTARRSPAGAGTTEHADTLRAQPRPR